MRLTSDSPIESARAEARMREASAKEAHLFATQKIENLKLMDKSRMAMRKLERELVSNYFHSSSL